MSAPFQHRFAASFQISHPTAPSSTPRRRIALLYLIIDAAAPHYFNIYYMTWCNKATQRPGGPLPFIVRDSAPRGLSKDFSQKCKLEKWTKMTPKFSQNRSKNVRKAAMQRGLPCCGAGPHGPMNTPPIISASCGAATLQHPISVELHAAFKICCHSSHPAPRGSGENPGISGQ